VLALVGSTLGSVALLALGFSEILPGTEIREGCVILGLGLGILGAYHLWRWMKVARTGFIEFRQEGFAYGRTSTSPQVLGWEQIYFVRLHQQDQQVQKLEIRLRDRSSHFIFLADESALRRLARLIDPGPETLAWIGGQVAAGRPLEEAAKASGIPDSESLH
jgi:hypothetical protein